MRVTGITATGITVTNLRATQLFVAENGITTTGLTAAGISATDMRISGMTATGITVTNLRATQLFFAENGITTTGLTAAGISATDMRISGMTATGITVTNLRATQLFVAENGITTTGLTAAGISATDMRVTGMTATGITVTNLRATQLFFAENGITTTGLTATGITVTNLRVSQTIQATGGINTTSIQINSVSGTNGQVIGINSGALAWVTSSGSGSVPTLDQVCTQGATTNILMTVGGMTATGITVTNLTASQIIQATGGINTSSIQINSVSGGNGQVIGMSSGTLTWITTSGSIPTLDQVCTQGSTTSVINVGLLTIRGVSINSTSTGTIEIGTGQTSGLINIGFTTTRSSTGTIFIGNDVNTNKIGSLAVIGNTLHHINTTNGPIHIGTGQTSGFIMIGNNTSRTTGTIYIGNTTNTTQIGNLAVIGNVLHPVNTTTGNVEIGTGQTTGLIMIGNNTSRTASGTIFIGNTLNTTILGNLAVIGNVLHPVNTTTGSINIGTGQTSGLIMIGNNASRTASGTIFIGNNVNTTIIGNLAVIGSVLHPVNTTTGNVEIGTGQTSGLIMIGNNASRTASGTIFIGNNVNTTILGNLAVIGNVLHPVNTTNGNVEIGTGQTSGLIIIGNNASRTASGTIFIGNDVNTNRIGNVLITGTKIQQTGGDLTLGIVSNATNIGNLTIYGEQIHNYNTDIGNIYIGTEQTSGQINLGNNATRTATGTIYIGTGNVARTQIGNLVVHGNTLHHVSPTGNIDIGIAQTSGQINLGNNATRTATGTIYIGTGNVARTQIGNLVVYGNTLNHVNTTGTIEIGTGQTNGILNIGTGSRTAGGTINIGTVSDIDFNGNMYLSDTVYVKDSTGSFYPVFTQASNLAGLYQINDNGLPSTYNINANSLQHDSLILVGYKSNPSTGFHSIQFQFTTTIRSNWRCTVFNHSNTSIIVTSNAGSSIFVGPALVRTGVAGFNIASNTSCKFRHMSGLGAQCTPPSGLTSLIYVEEHL
jgi:hypothetical protein